MKTGKNYLAFVHTDAISGLLPANLIRSVFILFARNIITRLTPEIEERKN